MTNKAIPIHASQTTIHEHCPTILTIARPDLLIVFARLSTSIRQACQML